MSPFILVILLSMKDCNLIKEYLEDTQEYMEEHKITCNPYTQIMSVNIIVQFSRIISVQNYMFYLD